MAISSPLIGAFNNIVNINRSKSAMNSTRSSFNNFLNFMEIETKRLEAIELPEERKIKSLQSLNVASTFGRPGSLLSSLFSGALDVGGFLGNMFGGKGKQNPKAGQAIPKGKGIRLGGVKALGIVNAVFAGLDFAQGISEGESVGKAAAGAGGALAGSIVGAALGSVGGPLGAIAGSMAGNFLGGYLFDRGYETVTGEGKSVKEKTRERLRAQEQKQREQASTYGTTFADVTLRFDQVVSNFEKFAYTSFAGMMNAAAAATGQEQILEYGDYGERDNNQNTIDGDFQDMEAAGGTIPSSSPITGKYGESRPGHMHAGVDYAPRKGTPISVIQPGRVSSAEFRNNGYGNQVKVDHPGGVSSFYAHLDSIGVRVGQQIDPGTVIGTVGSTGHSTGPHLHFEVDVNGKRTDPTSYADKIFRFGGNVKVKAAKQQTSVGNIPTSNINKSVNTTSVESTKKIIPGNNIQPSQNYRETPPTTTIPTSRQQDNVDQNTALLEAVVRSGAIISTMPQQVSQYPSYNMTRNNVTLIPIIQGQGSQQRPMVISSGNGGQQMMLPSGPSKGAMLNNVVKTLMLTNLSGS